MTWLIWRQHRAQVAIAIGLLAALAVPVWTTGRSLRDQLAACRAGTTCGGLFQGYQGINTVVDLTVVVPVLIGTFWAATLASRELETGTAALVWTQSVTRRRWIVGKLGALFGFAAVCAAVDTALVTWWSDTHNAVVESRLAGLQFDIQGIAPIGYTLFAAGLGLMAGALWRRTLPAMASTIGGFVAVRLVVELYVRPHFMAPVMRTFSFARNEPVPPGALAIRTDLTLHGRVITGPIRIPEDCAGTATRNAMNACMGRHGYVLRATYQPAGRYWSLQWNEFGLFAALAAVLAAVAVAVLIRRDA